MQDPTNDRVTDLLKTLKMTEMDLARAINKPASTIYRITQKKTIPSKPTLQLISNATKASYDWLLTGQGDMFANSDESTAGTGQGVYRDALINRYEEENSRLQKEVERLWQLLGVHMKLNFHNPSKKTGSARILKVEPAESLEAA